MKFLIIAFDQQNQTVEKLIVNNKKQASIEFCNFCAKYTRFAIGAYKKENNEYKIWAQRPTNKWHIPTVLDRDIYLNKYPLTQWIKQYEKKKKLYTLDTWKYSVIK